MLIEPERLIYFIFITSFQLSYFYHYYVYDYLKLKAFQFMNIINNILFNYSFTVLLE